MSTNKRINKGKVGSAAKKLCLRNPNTAITPSPIKIPIQVLSKMCDVEVIQSPVKSESDKKSYRVIRLSNGLKAVLVSDPSPLKDEHSDAETTDKHAADEADPAAAVSSSGEESEGSDDDSDSDDEQEGFDSKEKQAACSLCVDVGSFSDPRDVQGLSHFLGMSNNIIPCILLAHLSFFFYRCRAHDFHGFGEVSQRK